MVDPRQRLLQLEHQFLFDAESEILVPLGLAYVRYDFYLTDALYIEDLVFPLFDSAVENRVQKAEKVLAPVEDSRECRIFQAEIAIIRIPFPVAVEGRQTRFVVIVAQSVHMLLGAGKGLLNVYAH